MHKEHSSQDSGKVELRRKSTQPTTKRLQLIYFIFFFFEKHDKNKLMVTSRPYDV